MVMNTIRSVIAVAFVVMVAGIGLDSNAQRQYQVSDQQVRRVVNRIQFNTTTFSRSLSSTLNQRQYQNIRRDINIDQSVLDFQNAVNVLRRNVRSGRSTTGEVEEVLRRASTIDSFMRTYRFAGRVDGDWSTLRADLNNLASLYNIAWRWDTQENQPFERGMRNRLTGTYVIDTFASDDARDIAERATRTVSIRDRRRVLDELTARLESPDRIAIDRRGQNVTIASSRAPQFTFEADGVLRSERAPDGRLLNSRAIISGDQLIVETTGDRVNDYTVTFDPIDAGRRLRVTRRVSVVGLAQPVTVQSVYNKTSETAQWNVYTGLPGTTTTGTTSGDFIVPNGTEVVATLNQNLSTEDVREGDRFTLTVRSPQQFRDAIIEGYVTNIQRSGRVAGRAEMTFNFDRIRLANGRTYDFAGLLEHIRTTTGEEVSIDNEGTVEDPDSQTTRTITRSAIGTAVGAIIGAIAGGGKGAAIGAVIGAGAGAGSVYVQGRDDLELLSGTELTIRTTGPR